MPSMGYVKGWMHYMDLTPLDDAGQPPVRAEVASFAIQRQIQEYAWEAPTLTLWERPPSPPMTPHH